MPYSARFFLKDPHSDEPTLIFLILKYGYFELTARGKAYKHFKYSTGERVHPKYWSQQDCRVKANAGFTGCRQINALLDKYENQIIKICRQAAIMGIPITPDYLRLGMNEYFCRHTSSRSGSLLQLWKNLKSPIISR